MEFELDRAVEVLERTPSVLRSMLNGLSDPWVHGKYGPDTLHITVHPWPWWEAKIREHMSTDYTVLWKDRLNDNGTWVEVRCV